MRTDPAGGALSGGRRPMLVCVLTLLVCNAIAGGRGSWVGETFRPLRAAADRFAGWLTLPAGPIYRGLGGRLGGVAATTVEASRVMERGVESEAAAVELDLGDGARDLEPDRLAEAYAAALTEIERLRQINQRLAQDLEALGPVRQLLEEYGLGRRQAVSAAVSGRAGGVPPRLKIQAGARQRVRPGDPVVFRYNLVGLVAGSDPTAGAPPGADVAEVLTLESLSGSVGVRIVSPPVAADGMPIGTVARSTRSRVTVLRQGAGPVRFLASGLAAEADVRPGDWVRVADPVLFPDAAGFVLGEVVSVAADPSHPTLLSVAEIRSRVEPHRLTRVTVLVRPPVEPEPAEARR